MKTLDLKLIVFSILILLSTPTYSQTESSSEKFNFWEHLYMPLEMGYAISTSPNQDPAYLVNTGLEYRFGRSKGWFVAAEYDEHTHSYKDLSIRSSNTVEGDIRNTDFVFGPGWRQPLFKKISGTCMVQMGMAVSTLKHVSCVETGERYHLSDNKMKVPTAKLRIGLEYVFDPSFNLFIQASYNQHLKAAQLEHNGTKGVISISAGFNVNLL